MRGTRSERKAIVSFLVVFFLFSADVAGLYILYM